jgi:CzcA family heavy metal efflux pump
VLSKLVAVSIRFRGVVLAIACLVIGYGIYSAYHARLDVYPEFAPPQVVVQTEAPGLSPENVEQLVTRVVESSLNGAPNVETIRSQSIQGLSVVTVVFEERTDVYRARQIVSERLAEAGTQLPQGVLPPKMAPLTATTSLALVIGITSEQHSEVELRTLAEWTMKPRLLGVPGVARVSLYGGGVRQLQIQLAPERLTAYGISVSDVATAARTATGVRGAGFVETPAQRIVLESEGQSLTAEELENVVLQSGSGRSIRLRDVATVREGAEPKIGDATIMGKAGVLLLISSQYGANTIEVTQGLEKAIEDLRPGLNSDGITLYPDLFRPANFITTSLQTMSHALWIGAALVAIVLFIFLFNIRVAFISLTAIPLSLLVAVIILYQAGVSLNTLTLGGLAIAIGEVVDDAIIDAENIFRRLREAGPNLRATDIFRIVHDASVEVRSAVVYATLIVALVFLPVLTMSGVQGRLFAPLGTAYILAIVASLLVALTVTPALSYFLLPKATATATETRFVAALKRRYVNVLSAISRAPRLIAATAVVLVVLAVAAVPFLGGEFLPPLREGHYIVHMVAMPGTSLEESIRLGKLVTAELRQDEDIRIVSQQIGRAESGDDTAGVHYSEIHVDLKPLDGDAIEGAEDRLREILDRFPGVSMSPKTFLTERMEEVLSGVQAQVVVQVFGDDLDMIDEKAREVLDAISSVHGVADPQIESPPGTPSIVIHLRPDRLIQAGLQPVTVLDAIQTAYQGATVGQVFEANRVFNVAAILDPRIRQVPEAIGSLLLTNADGARIKLADVADVYQRTGRYSIAHEGTRRRQAVYCNVRGRDVASFVEEAERTVRQKVKFPAGVYTVFGGVSEARKQAQQEILTYSIVAGVGIILLLAISFHTVRNMLLVLVNLPFALVGGVVAAVLTGGTLSIGSIVGFVTLFGITTRNSIMMISHFEHLVRVEGETWGLHAVLRGASERLTPVLMTATVTGLGLLPLAIGSGQPGKEIEGPMAIVILGGLATSTALNLLVLPSLALRYGRFESQPAEE